MASPTEASPPHPHPAAAAAAVGEDRDGAHAQPQQQQQQLVLDPTGPLARVLGGALPQHSAASGGGSAAAAAAPEGGGGVAAAPAAAPAAAAPVPAQTMTCAACGARTAVASGMDESFFEGPEKKIEVVFKPDFLTTHADGLRELPESSWHELLTLANCSVLSSVSSSGWDAYLLSESSLFISRKVFILKTCGTTTLLAVVPRLLALARSLGAETEFVCFSRKNYNFQERQPLMHQSFDAEVQFLQQFFAGEAFVLGPITGDHFFMYIADYTTRAMPVEEKESTLEILMSELDINIMRQFHGCTQRKGPPPDAVADVKYLMPGCLLDEHEFDPCGYSMNGLLGSGYVTIHVTPEEHCSYVSFETNIRLTNYTPVIQRVLHHFKPRRVTVSLFSDQGCPAANSIQGFEERHTGFRMISKSFYEFTEDYDCTIVHYIADDGTRCLYPASP